MWSYQASTVLREHRELLRIEWRDTGLGIRAHADTPFRGAVFDRLGREHTLGDVSLACATARRFSGPAYSTSYFLLQSAGLGIEVLELWRVRDIRYNSQGYPLVDAALQDELFKTASAAKAFARDNFRAQPGEYATKFILRLGCYKLK